MKTRFNVVVVSLSIIFISQFIFVNSVLAGSTKIAAAGDQSFLLKSDGTLWAWGDNGRAQLGDGTTANKMFPVQIGAEKRWVSITTGTYPGAYSLAIRTDGTLWGWGANYYGRIGDGTTVDKSSPVQIGTGKDWTFIAVKCTHSLALKSDKSFWGWGMNNGGQLGDGTTVDKHSPVQIGTDKDWVSIAVGYAHSLALKSNGTLWAWGSNTVGELGDGTTEGRLSPVQIGTDNTWVAIEAGFHNTFALKSDGTLWAWGQNNYAQLGDGTTQSKNAPTQIGIDKNWTKVVTYHYMVGHTLALKSDGTLWAWGRNQSGQLGDGATEAKKSPVQIGTDKDWVSVAVGGSHSIALKSNETLWVWGANNYGQLGDGTTMNKSTPVQINVR
jgi:alpha-tubulin suppressor-like RCC1 family protein